MKYACFLFLVFTACVNQYETVRNYDEAGYLLEEYTIDRKTKQKQGIYQSFDKNGKVIAEETYSNNVLNGRRRVFFSNDTPQVVEIYKNGLLDGAYSSYYENGKVSFEGNYVNGKMEGEWRGYYDNGQLKEIVQFQGDAENGSFIEYHANGKLKAKGNYLNGDQEHGALELYDESGALVRKMDCEQGICKTTWQANTD
jgi:antitoxin component YwqK of YwqJK toxin-antitoxin module